MQTGNRHKVLLTIAEIDALIHTVGQVSISDVHLCRVKQTATARRELIDVRDIVKRRKPS